MFVNFLLKNKVVSCTHELNYDTADWHCSLRTIQCGDFNNFLLISHTFNMFFPQIFLTFLTILTHFTVFFLYYWTLELLNRSKVLFSFTAGPKTSLLHLQTESSMTITSIFTRLAANFNSFWRPLADCITDFEFAEFDSWNYFCNTEKIYYSKADNQCQSNIDYQNRWDKKNPITIINLS